MTKNVPMTLVGSASALMSVERRSSMKTRMIRIAITPPNTMSCSTCSTVLADEARLIDDERGARCPSGTSAPARPASALTASATATVFWPDCLTHVEGDRLAAVDAHAACAAPRSRRRPAPTSRRRTAEPSGAVATMTSRMASTLGNSPTVRTLISRAPSSKRPAGTFRFSARRRCATIARRQRQRVELGAVELDLDLALGAALDVDRGHAVAPARARA